MIHIVELRYTDQVKKEQRECWLAEGGEHGILYYYMKTGRLEFYSVGEENRLLVCLKDHECV